VIVAVAVPAGKVPQWHAWAIAALRAEPALTVRVVRVPDSRPGPARPLAARLGVAALAPVDVAAEGAELAGADAILDLTGGGVSAEAPHGVWRFRIGEDDDPALPAGREIASGSATFTTALLRRTGGATEVVRTGRFGVTRWYPGTIRLALGETARWPAVVLSALAAGAAVAGTPLIVRSAPRPLGPLETARFCGWLVRRLAAAATASLLEVSEWNVGFVHGEAARLLSSDPLEVRWLPQPEPFTFIADPFVVERDGVRALLVETFEYDHGRGVIDALILDEDDNVVRRERAIDGATHLSYPYPVEIDGELYLVPETCERNEVALYRCVRFPDKWEREIALFPAFDGVDTTLFAHGGRWWAFCTRYSRGSTLALNAFHADSPRGPWRPHALNPIVVDVASARPAGQPFVVDGTLYRPAQDCSDSYGGGLVIARIDELTPDAYREEIVQRHAAGGFGRWNRGIHTVSFTRGRIVVDGKYTYRDLRKLPATARKAVGIARRLLRGGPANEATFA
jgi:hypothetical protein